MPITHSKSGPGSSVGIATGYGLDGPGIESRCRRDFPHLSRPSLGPTQPPVQWVPGLSQGVKSGRGVTLTPHPLLVPWSRKDTVIRLLPLCAVQPVQSLGACTRVHVFKFIVKTASTPDVICNHADSARMFCPICVSLLRAFANKTSCVRPCLVGLYGTARRPPYRFL